MTKTVNEVSNKPLETGSKCNTSLETLLLRFLQVSNEAIKKLESFVVSFQYVIGCFQWFPMTFSFHWKSANVVSNVSNVYIHWKHAKKLGSWKDVYVEVNQRTKIKN